MGVFVYRGCVDNTGNKRQGLGECVWSNGSVYHGYWKENLMHGHGVLLKHGERYEGQFVSGEREGYGCSSSGGNIREGQWRSDRMEGKGQMIKSDGTTYRGEWRGGAMHGFGQKHKGNVVDGHVEDSFHWSVEEGVYASGHLVQTASVDTLVFEEVNLNVQRAREAAAKARHAKDSIQEGLHKRRAPGGKTVGSDDSGQTCEQEFEDHSDRIGKEQKGEMPVVTPRVGVVAIDLGFESCRMAVWNSTSQCVSAC